MNTGALFKSIVPSLTEAPGHACSAITWRWQLHHLPMKVIGSSYALLLVAAKLEAFPDSLPLVPAMMLSAILANLLVKLFSYAPCQFIPEFGSCLRFKSAKILLLHHLQPLMYV